MGRRACKESKSIPIVVSRDSIGHPRGLRIRIDHANRGDVHQRTLVQQHVVLEGIQTHDQIGHEGPAVVKVAIEALDRLVVLIHHLDGHAGKDKVGVRDAAGRPLSEEIAGTRHFRGLGDDLGLARPRADEQDQAPAVGDLLDYAGSSPQVSGGLLEGDDVDALAYAVDVARIGWVPQRGVVAHVSLGGEKQLERDILGARGG